MIKRIYLLPLLLLFAVFSVSAERNFTSDKIVFLPQDFYVGDLVEMRVVIRPQSGVSVTKPVKFPDSYWVTVENAEVFPMENNEYELRVFLRPYAPGIRALPALQFGDIVLRDIRIQTQSVLDDENISFAPPAEQMLLPGTNYYIALIVGLFFFLPLFFIFFWNRLKTGLLGFIFERQRRRPYKRIMKAFGELENRIDELKGKEFYTILVDELRAYMTSRGSIDYTSATVREASRKISSDFGKAPGYYSLIKIFQLADQVKFGSRRVMIKRREDDLESAKNCVEAIEQESAGGHQHVDL